ncbi:amino acid transporter AVT1J-like [Limulus polyphemus]|uniref:Amino acid transporter AVT1J-like n=1 Tax=Limulus polyphemus TaxID=6850 RepID=A0ABM1BVV8_LIMPO|nr:amino acid transporter AVT1J-like [Limulus polyphemus]
MVGMSVLTTAVFVAGEMAGSGVLALPESVVGTGWIGVVLIVFCCVNAGYCGVILGRCWVMLEERWEEYQEKIRYPYAAIGLRASGRFMRVAVSFCVNFTLFGVATVFLLLSSQMIASLAEKAGIYFCYWVLILGAILCPLMWLGTPNDFWPVAVGALATTMIACFLLFINILTDKTTEKDLIYPTPSLKSFFLSFATILFSFGGASSFPTIQNDMKDRTKFPIAVTIAFIVLLVLYLPVASTGYAVYGSNVKSNILLSVTPGPIRTTIEVFLALHLFFAFLIVVNPTCQELEEMCHVPHRFSWKRCLLRSAMMVAILFVAESVPHFGKILNLIGGSTITMMTFVFPPMFYMLLCHQKQPHWPERTVPLHQKVYFAEIMMIGLIGGVISTYSALQDIFDPSSFSPPCYINIAGQDV